MTASVGQARSDSRHAPPSKSMHRRRWSRSLRCRRLSTTMGRWIRPDQAVNRPVRWGGEAYELGIRAGRQGSSGIWPAPASGHYGTPPASSSMERSTPRVPWACYSMSCRGRAPIAVQGRLLQSCREWFQRILTR
jgi:hypothetical protein